MKKLIVAFLLVAFASMAMADEETEEICRSLYGEMSLDELNKCKKRFSEEWIKFLVSVNYEAQIASKHYSEQKHLAFIKKHFTPIWYKITTNDKGQKVARFTCFNNEAEKSCEYRLKAPLKIKGKLNIRTALNSEDGCVKAPFEAEIKYEDDSLLLYMPFAYLQIKPNERNQKAVRENIPKWMLDGFGGEVSYEVEFKVANMSGYIGDFDYSVEEVALSLDTSPCAYPSYMVADNIKFIKKLSENKYETVEQYFKNIEDFFSLKLKTEDDFVNLHNSPNGEVLRKIYKKDFDDILIIEIPQTRLLGFNQNINEEWLKVLYFPPQTHQVKDATLGYIHKSQISRYYESYYDDIE